MTTDDYIKFEKEQYDINREAAKISAISKSKIDKYDFYTGKEILLSDQSRIIKQAKSPLGKAFENQTKTFKDQGIKQFEALKALKPDENKQDIKSVSRRDEN